MSLLVISVSAFDRAICVQFQWHEFNFTVDVDLRVDNSLQRRMVVVIATRHLNHPVEFNSLKKLLM
jgi:hypothetical protein